MKQYEKEVLQAYLDNEKAVLKKLEEVYEGALADIEDRIADLLGRNDSDLKHVVYQVEFQKSLKKQIETILDNLHNQEFENIAEYLTYSYEEGFIGTLYSIQQQGIPLVFPINQEQVAEAIQQDTKISTKSNTKTGKLYASLGEDITDLKKKIAGEISRGFAGSMSYAKIAANMALISGIPKNNAMRIARTEMHRIQAKASMDTCYKAREKGADIVKMWDSTLDSRTRDSHMKVDGEQRGLEEKFSNGLLYPGDPNGPAAEVINCRCALLQKARWALDAEETKYLGNVEEMSEERKKEIAKKLKIPVKDLKDYSKQVVPIKAKNYKDFKKQYKELWQYEGSDLQKQAEERIAGYKKNKASERVQDNVQKINTVEDISNNGSKTLQRTYEQHRISNNLNLTPYDDTLKDIVNANYGKLSAESASAFNDTIEQLVSEYDTPLQKIRTMRKEEFMIYGDSFAYVSHNYTVDSAELVINPKKCKDIDNLTDRIKELSENGYSVKIPDELADRYVATHEFAHTILGMEDKLNNKTNWANADYDKIKKARKEINKLYDEYMKEVELLTSNRDSFYDEFDSEMTPEQMVEVMEEYDKHNDILNEIKLSEYSLLSADEFMAEAFTQGKIGVNKNKYSDSVIEIIDRYFKR